MVHNLHQHVFVIVFTICETEVYFSYCGVIQKNLVQLSLDNFVRNEDYFKGCEPESCIDR